MLGAIVVEGHGEVDAAHNLVTRLSRDLRLEWSWSKPRRFKNLHQSRGILGAVEVHRGKNINGLLILRDEDDGCPARLAPTTAMEIAAANLPFPVAIVLLHREFETLFLPCVDLMAGRSLGEGEARRPGLIAGTRFSGNPEEVRGAKEWLSQHFPPARSYKPTLDQLPLTRMLDFARLRSAELPCFGSLERGLAFLDSHADQLAAVYPTPPEEKRGE